MACILPSSKEFKALMQKQNLSEKSLMAAIKAWRAEDPTKTREESDEYPSDAWFKDYKGGRRIASDPNTVLLYNRDYKDPFIYKDENKATETYNKLVKLFGAQGVYMYTDLNGTTTVGVYEQIEGLFAEDGSLSEGTEQAPQTPNVLQGIQYTGVTINPDYKGQAGTNRKTGEIQIRKASFTPQEVLDHLKGESGLPYSDQKKAVTERLAKEGWPMSRIATLISGEKEATSLVLLHELSHRAHKDNYSLKDYMSEKALAIETRATKEALEQINALKNPEGSRIGQGNVVSSAKLQFSEGNFEGAPTVVISQRNSKNPASVVLVKFENQPWEIRFDGLQTIVEDGVPKQVFPVKDFIRNQMVRQAVDLIPIGQQVDISSWFAANNAASISDLGDSMLSSFGLTLVTDRDNKDFTSFSEIWVRDRITTADLHIKEHTGGYSARTQANARMSSVTLALAENFSTAGEKATRSAAGSKYIGVLIGGGRTAQEIGAEVLSMLREKSNGFIPKNVHLNIAGNGIYTLSGTQEEYDRLLTDVLKYLLENGVTFTEVRSGGQTGIDEAGIKAAQNLGLNWKILAPAGYQYRTKTANIKGDVAGFTNRFNRKVTLVEYTVQEAPESNAPVMQKFWLTEMSNKEPFRSTKMLTPALYKDIVFTEEEQRQYLLRLLANEDIGIGDRIIVDTEASADKIIETVKVLKSLASYRVYGTADPVQVSTADFSSDDLQAFRKAGFVITENSDGAEDMVLIPTFSIGYSQYRLKQMDEERTLLSSGLFKDSELRALAKGAILKVSDEITKLNTNRERARELFGEMPQYAHLANIDFTKMTRADILNPSTGIGLNTLLDILIKEGIFNAAFNRDLAKEKMTRMTAQKMQTIHDNFDAFIRLGYDSLIGLEQVSFVDGYRTEEGMYNFEDSSSEIFSQEDDQIVQEVYGSSAEHWQIGFRQVSAVNSLSQQIKRKLGTLYVLDENGVATRNEYGMPETLNPTEATTKILSWTQGVNNIDEMISKLQVHLKTEPWLNQLVGTYHVDGKAENGQTQGILLDVEHNDQFRSQFYSNFKKYFQMYSITFRDTNGKTKIKGLNTQGFTDSVIKGLEAQATQAKNGALRIWDSKKGTFSADFNRLKRSILGELPSRSNPLPLVKESLRDLLGKEEVTDSTPATDAMLLRISEAYSILDMQAPSVEELRIIFPTAEAVGKFADTLYYTIQTIEGTAQDGQLNLFTAKNNAKSNYKKLAEFVAPIMGSSIEAVSYENGKLHYGYVTPAYMGMLISKLKGNVENYQEFINQEYGRYTGWFYQPEAGNPKGLIQTNPWLDPNETNTGWLNWWLECLVSDTAEGKRDRERLAHIVSLSDNKIGYADKSDPMFVASMLAMYFYDDNKESGYFAVPTLSNKQSEEYIRFRRISENYEDFITHQLTSKTFIQEVNRIRTVKSRIKKLSADRKIENFDTEERGGHFQFLSFLNRFLDHKDSGKGTATDKFARALQKYVSGAEMQTEGYSATLGDTTYTSELQYFIDALPQVIRKEMNKEFVSWVNKLEKQGFLKIDSLEMNPRGDVSGTASNIYKVSDKIGTGSTAVENLKEFFWNDFFASLNILQLTIGDLAMYKDTEDVQKRLAQLHSPGIRGNIFARDITDPEKRVSDGFERTVYLKDSINPSSILENIKVGHAKLLDNSRYRNADGSLNALGREYEAMLKDIEDVFEKVNWANAQGYSSPTSYRKKMHIFGKWDSAQEAVYQKLINGESLTLEDLKTMWQPLKPFVYSQIGKKNNSQLYMPMIKMGVQNKNSEFLLIIAGALSRAAGEQGSLLSAIFDVMEESARRKDGKGIDTIQFESAVKAGKTGVIDINGMSYSEAKNALEAAIYLNGDVTRDYNEAYVHALPFEDYAIQQENPSHFTGAQQQGSQDRILAITDIPNIDPNTGRENTVTVNFGDGNIETITVREAKRRYQNAVVENVRRSQEELEKRLGLNLVSKKLRNIALSELLREEILKDGRYGSDLLWACSTNEDGEFNIPLSDPTQAGRIQQLLNSIIKNSVYKQKIAGGPAVQVSSFGAFFEGNTPNWEDTGYTGNGEWWYKGKSATSDQLHVRFKDSKGNILFSSKEFEQAKKEDREEVREYATFQDYLTANQAQLAYLEAFSPIYDERLLDDFGIRDAEGNLTGELDVALMEKVNPKLLQMLGYRIPTERKYSMVPIKIVGFLPRNSGEGIMLPAELTTMSGSDFDVDKLYIMRYEFSRTAPKDVISEFARRFTKGHWEKYKDTYTEGEGFKMDIEAFLSRKWDTYQTGSLFSSPATIEGAIDNRESIPEALQRAILNAYARFLRSKIKYSTVTDNPTANNNNTILDIHWAMLTSPLTFDEVFTPGNFNEPKRVGYTIAACDNKKAQNPDTRAEKEYSTLRDKSISELKKASYEAKNILFAGTKVDFHRQNMVAAKLIGVFAQANVSHGFIGLHTNAEGFQDVTINIPNGRGFTLGDVRGGVHHIEGGVPIDREYSWDELIRESAVLASLLAASVDAVKDPILNLMNINMSTVNVAVALARLGLDIESIGWFLSTPTIKNLIQEYEVRSAEGHVRLEDIINEMKERMSKDQKLTFDENFVFDKNFFIFAHDEENLTPQYEYNLLELFNRISGVAEAFRGITHMTRYNSITSAVGPFASDTMVQKLQDISFETNAYTKDATALKEAVNNPMLVAFREAGYSLERNLLGQRLIQAGSFMEQVINQGQSTFGYMTEDLARRLSNFAMSYYMNVGAPVFDLSYENRKRMIDNFAEKEYLPLAEKYKNNLFIKNIERVFEEVDPETHAGNYYLTLRTKGMLPEQIEDIRTAWSQLYYDEVTRIEGSDNPESEENLALKLLEYNFFRTGFSFDPRTFTSLAPAAVRLGLPNYLSNLTEMETEIPDLYEHINNLLGQFMLNTGLTNVGRMHISDFTNMKAKDSSGRSFSGMYTGKRDIRGGIDGITVLEFPDGTLQYARVSIDNHKKATLTYLDKLGGMGNDGFEIDPYTDAEDMRSVYVEALPTQVPSTPDGNVDLTLQPAPEELSAFERLTSFSKAFTFEAAAPIESMQTLLEKLVRLSSLDSRTKAYGQRYKELLDQFKSGVSYEKIIDTINKENLCG